MGNKNTSTEESKQMQVLLTTFSLRRPLRSKFMLLAYQQDSPNSCVWDLGVGTYLFEPALTCARDFQWQMLLWRLAKMEL